MNILISLGIETEWRKLPKNVNFIYSQPDPHSIERAMRNDIDVLVTDAMPVSDRNTDNLRWIQLASAGTDQLMGHPLVHKEDIRVTNSAGMCAVHIAEFILGRILYHTKNFAAFSDLQKKHLWADRILMSRPCLRGQRALLIGYGGVGRETARQLALLGVRITAMDVSEQRTEYRGYMPFENIGDPKALLPEKMITASGLEAALPEADFVVLSVPLNSSTHHLVNARSLSLMKKTAILINVARGPVVNTDDLLEALAEDQIAHAYLDVFDNEPLDPGSPLWDNERVSITSHMAGVMPDALLILEDLFLKNLELFRKGRDLLNTVNIDAYR